MQERVLTLDLGNSTLCGGVWEGPALIGKKWSLSRADLGFPRALPDFLAAAAPVSRAILASVVPSREAEVLQAVRRVLGIRCRRLTWRTRTGLVLAVRRPSRVGPDRIANAVAAAAEGGRVIVVDIGTAVTCDAVGPGAVFLGGAIAPGPGLALSSLGRAEALLPSLRLRFGGAALGKDTASAMLAGAFWGTRFAVEGLIGAIRRELGWGRGARVAVTGGYAGLLLRGTPLEKRVDPLLTLRGLKLISDRENG